MTTSLFVFSSMIALASVSPGPNVVLIVDQAAKFGTLRTLPTILGNLACLMCVATAAALGVGAMLEGAPRLFLTLQLCGAIYLGYIGIRNLWTTMRSAKLSENIFDTAAATRNHEKFSWKIHFRQAFLVSATNPKSVLFLGSVFPSFIDPHQPVLPQFALLFATLMLIVAPIHIGYALMTERISRVVGNARFNRSMKIASGIAFITFALLIFGASLKS